MNERTIFQIQCIQGHHYSEEKKRKKVICFSLPVIYVMKMPYNLLQFDHQSYDQRSHYILNAIQFYILRHQIAGGQKY